MWASRFALHDAQTDTGSVLSPCAHADTHKHTPTRPPATQHSARNAKQSGRGTGRRRIKPGREGDRRDTTWTRASRAVSMVAYDLMPSQAEDVAELTTTGEARSIQRLMPPAPFFMSCPGFARLIAAKPFAAKSTSERGRVTNGPQFAVSRGRPETVHRKALSHTCGRFPLAECFPV